MSYRLEGYYKVTQLNGEKFFGKAMDTWDTEIIFELPNGRKRTMSKVGYQYADQITKEEWQEVLEKAKKLKKTDHDQA